MSPLPSHRWLFSCFLVNLCFRCVFSDPNLSFQFKSFGNGSCFQSQIALLGDAVVLHEGKFVEISGSAGFSSGKLISKHPFSLVAGNSTRAMAFSTHFVFSVPRENGNGLAFFMVPYDFPLNLSDFEVLKEGKRGVFSVEFDAFRPEQYGDLRTNSHVSVSSSSSIKLRLYSDEKLQAWINYEATGKRIEVSLRKFGSHDPYIPLLSYPIDLSALWKQENVVIGLASSSRNSSQKTGIYSWSFASRNLTNLSHSLPMNTDHFAGIPEEVKEGKGSSDCGTRILLALIFGAACGSFAALLVVFVWGLVRNRRPVMPEVVEVHEAVKVDVKTAAIEDGKVKN